MPRTRSSKTGGADAKEASAKSTSSRYVLNSQNGPPQKLLILPKAATPEARIVTLPNPRHGQPARYLVCPETGIYEFTRIAAPNSTPRSWLIETRAASVENKTGDDASEPKAQVMMGADLYIATTIDPLFLVLPALADSQAARGSGDKKCLFLSSDDHFDKLPEDSSHLSEILRWDKTRTLVEGRMAAICDTVEAGDESMFRLSEAKLLTAMLGKAKRMSDSGLPPSMEDKFVKSVLEAPIPLQKRDVPVNESQASKGADSEVSTPRTESTNSQSTAMSLASQPSTAATSFTEEGLLAADTVVNTVEASPDIVKLQRLRVAFDFICSSYVSPAIAEQLRRQSLNKDASSVDFSPLDKYLAKVTELRAEALATRSISDFSRKRGHDEEEDEARQEKKRKLEEEKKRKANQSRGVRDLKKVNTSGMKKMSDFFKAK
ncbi:Ribonuclease H2 subunit B [Tolypocladium ophioglossoides CBS 100239]|uniref:Ribonuclease H2 subunit B n=1 Tax=Tolypocladium ophioglossoides (strain CBS 100239) TaxID=1163406 RepID=A0A0L0N1Y9_TOLOC|nr:Ribonuclease H2 subunit B [Tolypocladium ophioglossoides CBS 100239]